MNIIKYNGKQYIQDTDGIIAGAEEIINQMIPSITHKHNIPDTAGHCARCNTAYRASEIKDGNRCPFCYKVIV
jgi:rRNA maturation endonuclease Nob1